MKEIIAMLLDKLEYMDVSDLDKAAWRGQEGILISGREAITIIDEFGELSKPIQDLADLQNGPPLERDREEWEALMGKINAFLTAHTGKNQEI